MKIDAVQYRKIARFIRDMKYIHGGDFVNATLIRHKDLKLALLDFEKTHIIDLESEILNGSHNDESSSHVC